MSFIPNPPDQQPGATGNDLTDSVVKFVDKALNDQAMAQAKQAAQGLKDSANSGGFSLTENGFTHLTQALIQIEQSLVEAQQDMNTITQAPKLGSSVYAQTVATHVQKGGAGDKNSADAVMRQLRDVLHITQDALDQAKKNYADNEHSATKKFK